MNEKIKKRWLEALRSGEYKQGTGALRQTKDGEDQYCCLGVLCSLYAEDHPEDKWEKIGHSSTFWVFKGYTGFPNYEVMLWAGIKGAAKVPTPIQLPGGGECSTLANANDSGLSFSEIADIIEKQF